MDTASKLDLIKQSIAGELEIPVYEAIQQGNAQMQSPEAPSATPQIPVAPTAPPASPSFATQIYDKKGELVTPSTSGVGLNQTMGSKRGSMIQPGQYKKGGLKDPPKKEKLPEYNPYEELLLDSDNTSVNTYPFNTIKKEKKVNDLGPVYQDKFAKTVAEWSPGTGEIMDAGHVINDLSKGDYTGAALSAAGFMLPIVPGTAVKKLAKHVKSKFSGKILKHGKVPPAQQHEYADSIVKGFTNVGKKLDDTNFDATKLTKDNIKVLGEQYGRPIVEVDIGGGKTQMFYKSTGTAGKLNEAGKSTSGMWQPYGGHMDRVNAKDWFIKGEGYKNFYGSKSFRDIAGNLDRLTHEDGGFKDWLKSKAREIKTNLHLEARPNAQEAIREEKALFANPKEGDPQWYGTTGGSLDAFRHSYATALNVRDHGLKGILAPMGHEFEALYKPDKRAAYAKDIKGGKPISSIIKESYQDIYNNLIGAYIGYTSDSDEEAKKRIIEKIKDKDLLFNSEEYIKKNIQPFKEKKYHGGLRKKFNTGGKRPTGKTNIKELQNHLISEGFDIGKFGADGIWGKDTQAAFDKYTARANNRGIVGHVRSPIKVSQSGQSYLQYLANAALQNTGLVKANESFFDVDEKDLRADELAAYKSMLRSNLNKGKKGKLDYREYSNNEKINNAKSSEAARLMLKNKGIGNILVKDALPFTGMGATKEALHGLTGNAVYTIDDDGNVHVQDNYDFNYSQKNIKKTGASVWDMAKMWWNNDEGSWYQNAHKLGDQVKSRLPVDINLGNATELGLTPQEMRTLTKYKPSTTKSVSGFDLFKRGLGFD
tara:strand:- start:3634 stop:6093 length:2460 start_codon:yes stop_codon:yes gene_type:complete